MNEVSGDSVSEIGQDSLDPRQQLTVNNKTYHYFSLTAAAQQLGDITKLPYSLRILIENLLRHESNQANVAQHIQAFVNRGLIDNPEERIPFYPTRVVLDEASGIEATIALASMRETLKTANEPVDQANPAVQTDLIIPQHEDAAGNIKHYPLLSWGQQALKNFNVVTPTTRTCEPIDYDYLAKTAWSCALAEEVIAYPDSHIGTHRYAAAANALGILSWHTDGIEAETAMLGLPLPLSVPKVVGIELKGKLNTDASAADLACAINAQLNEENASGKIVEFCGDALEHLSVDDRAVISCSIPETGALCGYFPIDPQTIEGLALRGRDSHTLKLIKAYSQTQQLWRDDSQPSFDYQITIDLSAIPSANAITKQANGLKNQSPIETKDRHAKKEGTQEKNDGINAQQPPMDSPASKTYCWTPTSAEIKPIQIPYAHSENQPGHFKTARIRALLADTPISNGATTYEPPIENLSAESDSDTFIVTFFTAYVVS